ncbi:MAG: N-acetylmuramoyl-L-alanine amidase [Chloroflexi bacterium]|nr:N-acetylmuramoyl-L-alanine amidase [Chloroflexota bacterium]MDA1239334.1 N-acetylmuramoyl-L-alanine amidase [Chloroflexota bacterium]
MAWTRLLVAALGIGLLAGCSTSSTPASPAVNASRPAAMASDAVHVTGEGIPVAVEPAPLAPAPETVVTAGVVPVEPAPVQVVAPSAIAAAALALSQTPGPPVIVLDPGHGGAEVGAANHGIVEKESNLDLAFRVEALLREAGVRVLLTREDDSRAVPPPGLRPVPGGSTRPARVDVQARVDLANLAGAAAFVSIHSNGHSDSSLRGIETYYSSVHAEAPRSLALATHLQTTALGELAAAGFPAVDRGARDTQCMYNRSGTCRGIFVISPPRVTRLEDVLQRGGDPVRAGLAPGETEASTRATLMPAALIELLFVSNPQDAAILAVEESRQAMARGVAAGILAFLAEEGLWPAQ